ncbi:MAG TPA: DUF4097 family beta strand repeat-containing protein [Spirillospora sp.]
MRTLTATAILAVAAAALTGCGNVTFGSDEETRSLTAPPGVGALKISGQGGHVEVIASDTSAIKVSMRLHWSNDRNKPNVKHVTRGNTLTLSSRCAGVTIGASDCRVSYRVEVPRDGSVNIESDDGPITASGLGGKVRLHSADGAITVDGLDATSANLSTGDGPIRVSGRAATADLRSDHGSVTARGLIGERLTARLTRGDLRLSGRIDDVDLTTSHGFVHATGLTAERVTARSDDGDLRFGFASPPMSLRAASDHGDVRVALPPGEGYAITAAAGSGDELIAQSVRQDSASRRRIDLTTDDGTIRVESGGQRTW